MCISTTSCNQHCHASGVLPTIGKKERDIEIVSIQSGLSKVVQWQPLQTIFQNKANYFFCQKLAEAKHFIQKNSFLTNFNESNRFEKNSCSFKWSAEPENSFVVPSFQFLVFFAKPEKIFRALNLFNEKL